MSESIPFGRVRIIEGEHKDRLGIYDDDEDGMAIVYLLEAEDEAFLILPYESIEAFPATEEVEKEDSQKKRPLS